MLQITQFKVNSVFPGHISLILQDLIETFILPVTTGLGLLSDFYSILICLFFGSPETFILSRSFPLLAEERWRTVRGPFLLSGPKSTAADRMETLHEP